MPHRRMHAATHLRTRLTLRRCGTALRPRWRCRRQVLYADGEEEWLHLRNERVVWRLPPREESSEEDEDDEDEEPESDEEYQQASDVDADVASDDELPPSDEDDDEELRGRRRPKQQQQQQKQRKRGRVRWLVAAAGSAPPGLVDACMRALSRALHCVKGAALTRLPPLLPPPAALRHCGAGW